MSKSFTGVAFPFHIGVRGGVAMSTTTIEDVPHIAESVEQIVQTRALERSMEYEIACNASTYLFDPNDESTKALIAHECREAIEKCDDRIEVQDIQVYGEENTVYADVTIKVKKYDKTYSVNTKVGDIK